MIYLDNAATTKIHPLALDTYKRTSEKIIGNPSSLHELGTVATRLLLESRKQIAQLLNVSLDEIFFTSGGTEGDNWVIKGTAMEKRKFGNHILVSAVEHPAVSESCRQLKELGFDVEIIPVNQEGFVDPEEIKRRLKKETILVSVMVVNNEVGMIQPIAEIGEILKEYPTVHFHVDAVQGITKVPTEKWLVDRVDFATFSGHKFHGPRGIGFIYWKKGRKIAPLLTGGGQENNFRSGTENLPGIVAMAKALRLGLTDEKIKQTELMKKRDYLIDSLATFSGVTLFTKKSEKFAPHIVCFSLKGIRGEVMVHALEEKQVIISTTSACASKKSSVPSTLNAMNVPRNLAETAVRVSLDETTTLAELEQFLLQFSLLYQKFSKINHLGEKTCNIQK